MSQDEATKKPDPHRSRRLSVVDIDKLQRRFFTVLKREANHLLDESYQKKLSEDSSKSLVNYLKLLKQLQEVELSALEALTDEELAERAKINTEKGATHDEPR